MLILYKGAVYRCADRSFAQQAQEKARYLSNARKRFEQLILKNLDALMGAAQRALDKHPEDAKKRNAAWKREVAALPAVQDYLRLTNLRKSNADARHILDRMVDVIFNGKDPHRASKELSLYLDTAFIQHKQDRAKKPMVGVGIPEEVIKQLLPKSFSFTVAPSGEVVKELSVFGNKAKTEMAKTEAMAALLDKWNDLVDTLNRDIASSDPYTKLCAIVSSIIVHTGIRPGTAGESRLKDESGKIVRDAEGRPVRIKTVGATGLRKEHVKFIRDDFAQLQFPGKAATWNVADLTDEVLVRALRAHIEDVSKDTGKDDSVFVTKEGKRISDKDVNAYMKRIIGDHISATDFRKLRATREFYNSLRRRKSELAKELRLLKAKAKREMRNKIVRTVVNHILVSAAEAQKAISHSDVRVTIESYISPRVVLEYLTHAGLDRSLEEVVSNSRGMLVRFDPLDFYNTVVAKDRTAGVRVATTSFLAAEPFSAVDIEDTIEELEL